MGGKQSTDDPTERYRSTATTGDSSSSDNTPRTFHRTSAPPVPTRNNPPSNLRHPLPPEPPPLSFLYSPPPRITPLSPPSHPPLPPRSNSHSESQLLSHNELSQRPLPTLPIPRQRTHMQPSRQQQPPSFDRFLDLEALLAGLDEIGPPESRRVRSSSHGHHMSRHGERRRVELQGGDVMDPLSFLRSLTRTRRCPNCSENILIEDFDNHSSSCTPKVTIVYNEDTLVSDTGECSICLEDMNKGDQIARLPCLCIYHIVCIEDWFKVKSKCPQHPDLQLPSV